MTQHTFRSPRAIPYKRIYRALHLYRANPTRTNYNRMRRIAERMHWGQKKLLEGFLAPVRDA